MSGDANRQGPIEELWSCRGRLPAKHLAAFRRMQASLGNLVLDPDLPNSLITCKLIRSSRMTELVPGFATCAGQCHWKVFQKAHKFQLCVNCCQCMSKNNRVVIASSCFSANRLSFGIRTDPLSVLRTCTMRFQAQLIRRWF